MSKAKKVLIALAAVLVLLAFLLVLAAGAMAGMGPFGFIHTKRMSALPGNAPEYLPSSVSAMEQSPLQGKTVCFLGSSVTYGSAALGNSLADYLGKRFDCAIVKEAVSGTTLVDTGKSSYVQRMLTNLDASARFDAFICQLSTNDATGKKPLGQVGEGRALEDFDTSTIAGAMEYIICYAQKTWDCPVFFYTGSRYESAEYAAMVALLPQLQEKWGIGVLDLWHGDAFNELTAEQRALYMNDKIHPTMAGYRDWWVPELERQLLEFLAA